MAPLSAAQTVGVCPRCAEEFSGLRFCPQDGAPLLRGGRSETPAHRPGDVVAGVYRIVELIGEGGMGAVYRVDHLVLGRPMAMKILHPRLATSDETVLRFEREARASSLLTHPHCVNVTDFGVTDAGVSYLCMELLEGVDLFDTLVKCRAFVAERAVRVLDQVLSALGEAHRQGIVHRDIKPENIFLAQTPDGGECAKILDFGIAKIQGLQEGRTLTSGGTVFGTPEYLAPEQAVGEPADARSDLYSLGVIMYRMLAGRRPFRGRDKRSLLHQQISEAPLPFSQQRTRYEVPEDLERICFKLLAKNKEDRYQSAEDVRAALRRADLRPARGSATVVRPQIVWIDFSDGTEVRRESVTPGPSTRPGLLRGLLSLTR